MRSLNWRGGSPNKPCEEYEKLKLVAEEILANVDDSTSPQQFEQVQKGLLFLFQELKARVDPWHFRFPGGHACLEQCYLHYTMLIRTRAVLQKPHPSPEATQQSPLSREEVLGFFENTPPPDTFFGEDRDE
jgi:hypothetical protein